MSWIISIIIISIIIISIIIIIISIIIIIIGRLVRHDPPWFWVRDPLVCPRVLGLSRTSNVTVGSSRPARNEENEASG